MSAVLILHTPVGDIADAKYPIEDALLQGCVGFWRHASTHTLLLAQLMFDDRVLTTYKLQRHSLG
jgi:hypothetical protein